MTQKRFIELLFRQLRREQVEYLRLRDEFEQVRFERDFTGRLIKVFRKMLEQEAERGKLKCQLRKIIRAKLTSIADI
jgi:hypothetical protein